MQNEKNGVSEQNDTELLLCLLAEVSIPVPRAGFGRDISGARQAASCASAAGLTPCMGRQVEEQFSESRGCVQGASSKLEEGKEFEAAAAERSRDQQLSEATRRKLQRRSQESLLLP